MSDPDFCYSDLLPVGADETPYRQITTEGVSTFEAGGRTFLTVEPEAMRRLTAEAMHDIAHYLRPAHLTQLRKIIDDPESSGNDRFVALDLLKNVNISAAAAIAGLGLDRTRVVIVADPTITTHIVELDASGAFGRFSFKEDVAVSEENRKTGKLVAMAMVRSVRQLASTLVVAA